MTAQAYLERYKQLTSIEDIKNNLIEVASPIMALILILYLIFNLLPRPLGTATTCDGA